MYADGVCARDIAATFNAEGIPSPGANWKRSIRRRDTKWLASAIHGDRERCTGILNNRRYIGVTVWGRSEWKRSAADSKKRRHRMLAKGSAHELVEERLRIVPQALWDRVKARQAAQSHRYGTPVRASLRKNKPGAGRPSKYPFSGLLACARCDASFTLRNRDYYACASWWNGRACSNHINVSRHLVQEVMMAGIREDLHDPAIIDEVEKRYYAAERQRSDVSPAQQADGRRIAGLEREIANLIDAITQGALRSSPALAERLRRAEADLERLQASIAVVATKHRAVLMQPEVRRRFLGLVDMLDVALMHDPERGRQELRRLLGDRIKLEPDVSDRFLWADYSLGFQALLPNAEIMVAGAGFEPATFGL
jgi:site-specific DNA recombinase